MSERVREYRALSAGVDGGKYGEVAPVVGSRRYRSARCEAQFVDFRDRAVEDET